MLGPLLSGIALGLVLVSSYRRFAPFLIPMTIFFVMSLGYARLDAELVGQRVAPLFGTAVLAAAAGYLAFRWIASKRQSSPREDSPARWELRGIWLVLIAMATLTAFHFAVVGVPILTANVETARYNLIDSGFFGLPSRAYLFGLPLAAAGAIYVARTRTDGVDRRLLIAAIGILVVSRIAGGFRSGLLEALLVVLIATALSGNGITIPNVVRRFALPTLAVIVSALMLSTAYATVQKSGRDPIDALVSRSTEEAARPGWLALQSDAWIVQGSEGALQQDLQYYANRYLEGDAGPYATYNQRVAAEIYGQSTYAARDLAPVTVGLFPQLHSDFGLAAIFLMVLVGGGYAWSERAIRLSRTVTRYILAIALLLALNDALTKGDPVYVFVNWTVVALMIGAGITVYRLWSERDGSREPGLLYAPRGPRGPGGLGPAPP